MPEQEQNQPQAPMLSPPDALTETQEKTETTAETKEGQGLAAKTATEKDKIPVIHTLKGDVSEYLKERNLSIVDIAAEASKRKRFEEETSRQKNPLILAAVVFLIIAGMGTGAWFIFGKKSPPAGGTQMPNPPQPFIFSEKQEYVTIKSNRKSELTAAIQEKMKSPIALNTVLDIPIYLETDSEKKFIQARQFLELLAANPPADFIQSLEGPFSLGLFYLKKNAPFLIFKISSFDLAFSGVLNWEKNILKDVGDVMLVKNKSVGNKFQDEVIQNHDARTLYDNSGNLMLVYAFSINRKYLVIATDTDTLNEIIRRLSNLQ